MFSNNERCVTCMTSVVSRHSNLPICQEFNDVRSILGVLRYKWRMDVIIQQTVTLPKYGHGCTEYLSSVVNRSPAIYVISVISYVGEKIAK